MRKFTNRHIVREALDNMPGAGSNTVAKWLMGKHPGVWPTLNAARLSVRATRGAKGKRERHQATHTRIEIPKPDDSGWKNHELPDGIKRWLIISDIHAPYHSRAALRLALEYGRSEGCDGVLIDGDLIDFYQLSHFEKDPRRRDAAGELEITKKILDAIEKVGAKTIVFKEGNHDCRMAKYLMQRNPEMFAVIDIHCNMSAILDLTKRGIKWIHDKHTLSHRDLTVIHGHEWGTAFFSPVNPARGAFLRAHDNVLQGHGHRTSDHTESTLRNLMISCWSIGCLCDLNPLYRPIANKWNHGFAVLNTGPKWSIENKRIISEKKIT